MELVSIQESPKLFPHKNGSPLAVSSIRYWILNGSRGIYLKGTKIGRTWFTSVEWVEEFIQACTVRSSPQQSDHLSRRAVNRRVKAAQQAMLSRFGVNLGQTKTSGRKKVRDSEETKAGCVGQPEAAGVDSC